MKKILLTISYLLFITCPTIAQEKPPLAIQKGQFTISAGYGAPSIIRSFLKINNKNKQYEIMGYGPSMLKTDYMLTNKWSVGLNFSYSFSRLSWMDYGWDSTIKASRPYEYGVEAEEFSLLIRSNYHFYNKKKIDAYVGAGFGLGRIYLGTYTLAPQNQFSVGYSIPRPISFESTVGMRYYFTKHIGIYTEVGLGKSWLLFNKYFIPESIIQGGINVKF
jgi:opacity protein-like surface antigen